MSPLPLGALSEVHTEHRHPAVDALHRCLPSGAGTPPSADRGAALVEAALVLPLLLMLTLGIWTTARAWNIHNVLDHAAREAARYAATTPDSLAVLDPIGRGELLAASIPWSDVSGCSSIIENGTVIESATAGGGITVADASPGYCIPLGGAAGQDPTTDDRAQVRLAVYDFQLDFVLFSFEVDLSAQAVSRLEP